jgi:hypothetical protein
VNNWFTANKLAINLDKINVIKFITYNSSQCPLHIGYNDKYIEESVNTKFLGLQTDNHLNWINHTDQQFAKLSWASNAVRPILQISNTGTLKLI